jgi:twitching motility two-component system response regulator PilH
MPKTVLSVDDEAEAREFVSAVLEENGYFVILAANVEEALDIIEQKRPDLVILDILMPKQSGIKLYRTLKTSDALRNIPVIVYSGVARRTLFRAQASLTETSGVSVPEPEAYLEKPVTAERMVAVVKRVLGQGSE